MKEKPTTVTHAEMRINVSFCISGKIFEEWFNEWAILTKGELCMFQKLQKGNSSQKQIPDLRNKLPPDLRKSLKTDLRVHLNSDYYKIISYKKRIWFNKLFVHLLVWTRYLSMSFRKIGGYHREKGHNQNIYSIDDWYFS